MATKYAAENAKSLARLRQFVNSVTDAELKLVIYKEGWTVAVALAHLAFWDERRRVMLKLWKQEGVKPSPYVFDIINDALIPVLLAIPPRKAAELAVTTAAALDKELEELPPEMVKAIEALKEPTALDRAHHRNMHLDEINALLKAKGKPR
jgi:hypothetical protein